MEEHLLSRQLRNNALLRGWHIQGKHEGDHNRDAKASQLWHSPGGSRVMVVRIVCCKKGRTPIEVQQVL